MFTSWKYYLCLILVATLYWLLKKPVRKYVLLISSYLFYYAWEPDFFWFLIIETVALYITLTLLFRYQRTWIRRSILFSFIFVIIALWLYFKVSLQLTLLVTSDLSVDSILRPLGASFFTFQALSYAIDCYSGKYKFRVNIFDTSLYMSFFPQLVSGPIERSNKLIPQFSRGGVFSLQYLERGCAYIFSGLFVKLFMSNNFLNFTSALFSEKIESSYIVVQGAIFSIAQVYTDFMAYTLIAIGSAALFGITLSENFRRPFHSGSIRMFWSRWHMTLTRWFKDYLYLPIIRVKFLPRNINKVVAVIAVFILCAFWHRIAFVMVVFGVVHVVLIFFENFIFTTLKKSYIKNLFLFIPKILGIFSVYLFFAPDLAYAIEIYKVLFGFNVKHEFFLQGLSKYNYVVCLFALSILFCMDSYFEKMNYTFYEFVSSLNVYFKCILISLMLFLVIVFGEFSTAEFFYTQF